MNKGTPTKRKRSAFLIILVSVITVILLGFTAYFAYQNFALNTHTNADECRIETSGVAQQDSNAMNEAPVACLLDPNAAYNAPNQPH